MEIRAATPELRALLSLAARPEVEEIRVIPSSSRGRSPDMVYFVRDGGKLMMKRYEVTTVTGEIGGYKPANVESGGTPEVDDIVRSITVKIRPGARGTTQFDAPLSVTGPKGQPIAVPPGGTLGVHLAKSAGKIDSLVQTAMDRLKPALAAAAPYPNEIQFLKRRGGVIRYVRTARGFVKVP
jgi:hypothetical protein